jgi:hypothetical protein
MSEVKFQDARALEAWLKEKGVDPDFAPFCFPLCFLPSTIIGISPELLRTFEIDVPVAQQMSNRLKEQPQPNGKFYSVADTMADS